MFEDSCSGSVTQLGLFVLAHAWDRRVAWLRMAGKKHILSLKTCGEVVSAPKRAFAVGEHGARSCTQAAVACSGVQLTPALALVINGSRSALESARATEEKVVRRARVNKQRQGKARTSVSSGVRDPGFGVLRKEDAA